MGTKPLAALINNAGVMGGTKRETMEVNLLATTVLTLSLLEWLKRYAYLNREKEGEGGCSEEGIGEDKNLSQYRILYNI